MLPLLPTQLRHSPPPFFLHLKPRPLRFITSSPLQIPILSSFKPINSTRLSSFLSSSSQTLNSFSKIKPYLLSERTSILSGWLCSLVSVLSLSQIVPRIGSFTSDVNSQTNLVKLRADGFLLGILVLVRILAGYWQQAFLWEVALNAGYNIRLHVFGKVLEREIGFFEGRSGLSPGDIAHRITAEASHVSDTIYALLNTIVPGILQLSAIASQMLVISPLLSLVSAMVIPCMALLVAYLGERLRKISKKAHLCVADLSSYLNEVLPAILLVKANNVELSESKRFERLAHAVLSEQLKKKKMKALIPQIIQTIYFGALFIFCAGSLILSGGSFSASSMVSFVTSLIFLIEPIQDIGKAYNELKQGEPAIERLFDLTRSKLKVVDNPYATDLESIIGEVKFCDISFGYGENMPLVLDGLNLHIKAGETVSLVGPSGGGKTTLIKLFLRLYDPLSGSIFVDNHNIRDIRLGSLRRHVGLVSQDITLFSGTVAENIGYRDLMTKVDMEKVELAAQAANADEFIRTLPEGYETKVGPRGSSLSGGQKQRLAIARALYQNSSILILDEATSALDSKSELLVRQAVERLMENHTVLVIAHRLETVLMAQRVLLLDKGKLVELTHTKLLDSSNDLLLSSGLVI